LEEIVATEIPVTSELNSGVTVIFDAPYTEADDYDDTWQLFELFNKAVGA
jgi:hypothetical protein